MSGIGEALAKIPSGVSVLTAAHDGRSTGMLASWIQQASFRPPMITVCVKRGRAITPLIVHSRRFCLNILGENSSDLMKHFGSGFSLEQDAFAGLGTETTAYGVLLRDALGHLQCTLAEQVEAGDHDVVIGEIAEGTLLGAGAPYVHLRKTGLSY